MTRIARSLIVRVVLLFLVVAALSRAAGGPAAAAAAAAGSKTAAGGTGMPALVVLVRHAEKAATPKSDPPLTKAGKDRALALVPALKDVAVTAIISSDAVRSRETAQPLADARGLTPLIVKLGQAGASAHAEAVVAEIRRQAGGVVVVVDHSDTIPLIIAALGGPRLPEIPSKEYADLFLLVPASGKTQLVRARYGAPDAGS